MRSAFLNTVIGTTAPVREVVVDARSPQIKDSRGFRVAESPFTRGGDYLVADARVPAKPAAVRVAAPVLAELLLATLVLGLISRVLPALSAFSIGLNMNALVLMAILSLSLGGVAWLFEEQATASVQAVMETLDCSS